MQAPCQEHAVLWILVGPSSQPQPLKHPKGGRRDEGRCLELN
jgi:hypothetical protein